MNYPNMCCELETKENRFENEAVRCEPSVKEQLQEIEKKLIDTRSVLMNIIEGMTNAPRPDNKLTEEGCMQDTITCINGITGDCLGMANRIHQLMF